MQGLDKRLAALLPDRSPLLSRAAADLGLDRVELPDPAQGLFRQRRAGGLMDLVKASPAMRPAESEPDLTRRPVLQQALEAGIAVHLQHALELGQVGGRVLALAVLGVEEDHRRRGAAVPGPVVDGVAPQPPGLGPAPAGVEHRQRRVIGEDPGRGQDMLAQEAPQRLQPPAGPAASWEPDQQERTAVIKASCSYCSGAAIGASMGWPSLSRSQRLRYGSSQPGPYSCATYPLHRV